jgi:hypothetical protein
VELVEIPQDGRATPITDKNLAHPHSADEKSEDPTHVPDGSRVNAIMADLILSFARRV